MPERKVLCGLPNRAGNEEENCKGVIAHQISPRMLQIGRQDGQRISIIGQDWSATVTCPRDRRVHSFVCKNGQIDETGKLYEEVTPQPNGDPDDPNNANNPGQIKNLNGEPTLPVDPKADDDEPQS